jgi:MscS family membrane protein
MGPEFLNDLIGNDASEIVTKLIVAALILLLTMLIRRLAKPVISYVIHLTSRTNTALDEKLVTALLPPAKLLVGIGGIWIAFIVLETPDRIEKLGGQLATSLIAVAMFWSIYRSVDIVADSIIPLAYRDPRIDTNIIRFGRQLSKGIVLIFAFVIVMQQLGYNLNGLLAGLGLGGLAVALAAQEALSNLIGYFAIMADSPFVIDDFIDTSAGTGTVERIGFRSTQVRKLDQSLVFIPNSLLARTSVTNWSRLIKRRLDMYLGITYESSPEQILSVVQGIREMLNDHESVMQDTVVVQFVEFNDSSLDIRIIAYLEIRDWGEFQVAKQDINLRIIGVLNERGVEVAFPTRTIMLERPDTAKSPADLKEIPLEIGPEPPPQTLKMHPSDANDEAADSGGDEGEGR